MTIPIKGILISSVLLCSIGIFTVSCGKPTASSSSKKTIRFVAMEYDTNTAPFTKKLAHEYMQLHPDVNVICRGDFLGIGT